MWHVSLLIYVSSQFNNWLRGGWLEDYQVLHCRIRLDRRDSWQDPFASNTRLRSTTSPAAATPVRPFTKDDADRLAFLVTLEAAVSRFNWPCRAYCLIGNHYHLLLETPDASCTTGI